MEVGGGKFITMSNTLVLPLNLIIHMYLEIQEQFNNVIPMQLKAKNSKSARTLNIMMEFHRKLNVTF
jgi:hypothetical protein